MHATDGLARALQVAGGDVEIWLSCASGGVFDAPEVMSVKAVLTCITLDILLAEGDALLSTSSCLHVLASARASGWEKKKKKKRIKRNKKDICLHIGLGPRFLCRSKLDFLSSVPCELCSLLIALAGWSTGLESEIRVFDVDAAIF